MNWAKVVKKGHQHSLSRTDQRRTLRRLARVDIPVGPEQSRNGSLGLFLLHDLRHLVGGLPVPRIARQMCEVLEFELVQRQYDDARGDEWVGGEGHT